MAAEGFSSDDQAAKRKQLKLNFPASPRFTPLKDEVKMQTDDVPVPEKPLSTLASMGHPTQIPVPPRRLNAHGGILAQPGSHRTRSSHGIHHTKASHGSYHHHRHHHSQGSHLARMGYPTQTERLRSHSLESAGKLKISPESTYDFTSEDLVDQGEIGRGAYGTVNQMYHEQSQTVMAVKRIRSTVDEKEQKQLLMDLDVVMRSNDCPAIVQFYGALFKEGDCWICMELMSISLDKFYKYVNNSLNSSIPEEILGKITVATVSALNYLKEKLKIIHRDVKPSNILLDKSGNIKLCDFGISGQLVDSIAKTRDAGCRPYMAPERIDPRASSRGYDVRSDVWSLGITLVEVATGKFPYPKWNSVFDQLTQVVQGEPPFLRDIEGRFSPEFKNFVNTCLTKDQEKRPKYKYLLKDPFIQKYEAEEVDVAGYVLRILADMPADRSSFDSSNSS